MSALTKQRRLTFEARFLLGGFRNLRTWRSWCHFWLRRKESILLDKRSRFVEVRHARMLRMNTVFLCVLFAAEIYLFRVYDTNSSMKLVLHCPLGSSCCHRARRLSAFTELRPTLRQLRSAQLGRVPPQQSLPVTLQIDDSRIPPLSLRTCTVRRIPNRIRVLSQ